MKLRFSVSVTALIAGILGLSETFLVPLIPNPLIEKFVTGLIPLLVLFLYQEEGITPPPSVQAAVTVTPSV